MAAPDPTGGFATTRWSLVIDAAGHDAPTARASLLTLCLRYWYPVYAYLRRSGHAPGLAHELARAFFDSVVSEGLARQAMQRQGRFRLFLLSELHRFLSSDAARATPDAGIDAPALEQLEQRHQQDLQPPGSPEDILRRGFALEVLGAAHQRLRTEAIEAGHLAMFEALARFLASEPRPGDYDAVASRLGLRPMFVSLAVRRLRQRYRELVDEELGQTLASAEDMAAERAALMQSLGELPP
ncbi:MAG: hypothetical protein ABS41_02120 [Arenimonas sp. SCN 70-307]|uniref:hypothetical protein n=1 Tax=Arenimonas sp. SCN 70-307 TaxID=1660089 RepID=UPI0008693486|nr:hypothetical protein [Arenimonas sp. SCN 70-307]ODS64514.1 MAG: hypothetical protein ABS41_02120 [Arenimonas sp. SCN 70-307]